MVGDIVTDDGEVYEVVFDGRQELIGERTTKAGGFWTPPHRLYNKKNKAFWEAQEKAKKERQEAALAKKLAKKSFGPDLAGRKFGLDNPEAEPETAETEEEPPTQLEFGEGVTSGTGFNDND